MEHAEDFDTLARWAARYQGTFGQGTKRNCALLGESHQNAPSSRDFMIPKRKSRCSLRAVQKRAWTFANRKPEFFRCVQPMFRSGSVCSLFARHLRVKRELLEAFHMDRRFSLPRTVWLVIRVGSFATKKCLYLTFKFLAVHLASSRWRSADSNRPPRLSHSTASMVPAEGHFQKMITRAASPAPGSTPPQCPPSRTSCSSP